MKIAPAKAWRFAQESWQRFSDARAAGRGAAISFYAVTAIIPVILIVIAVAGLVIGRDTASAALFSQFEALLGRSGADFFRRAATEAASATGGVAAAVMSGLTLLFTASGVFLELEEALNAIWEAKPRENLASMARARAISLGLVIALGFLLLISLVIDAAIAGFSGWMNTYMPEGKILLLVLNQIVSVFFLTAIFAGIMKYLPKKPIAWQDVFMGAAFTAVLFIIGKFLIGIYLSSSATVSALGEAGALLALLFWVYYTAQIFLFGAACTRIVADHRQNHVRA